MKRISLLAALLAVMMVAVAALAFGGGANAQEEDPLDVAEALVEAANESFPSGDPTAFVNVFTEDGVFTNRDDAFMAVGRPAMMAAFGFEPDPEFEATLIDAEVDGNVVTGSANIADQDSVDAGVGSHIELFTLTVEDGLVSSFVLTYDHDDPDTVTYLEYLDSQGGEDGEEPFPDQTEIELTGDQPGSAFIGEFDEGISFLGFIIEPGAEGVYQPAHVHTGTCDEPGGVVYPLAYLVDGGSFTILSTTVDELLSNDYIANVHLSEAEASTYVACGVLESDDAGEPGLPSTGAGGPQTSDDSNGLMWLVAALGIGGAVVAGAGVVFTRRR